MYFPACKSNTIYDLSCLSAGYSGPLLVQIILKFLNSE